MHTLIVILERKRKKIIIIKKMVVWMSLKTNCIKKLINLIITIETMGITCIRIATIMS